MASTARFTRTRVRCYWRPIILAGAAVVLLGTFWFASRYPQLLHKAEQVGKAVPSMAYGSEVMAVAADAPGGTASSPPRSTGSTA